MMLGGSRYGLLYQRGDLLIPKSNNPMGTLQLHPSSLMEEAEITGYNAR